MQKTIDKQITDGLHPIDPNTKQRTTLLPRMWNQVKGFPAEAMVFTRLSELAYIVKLKQIC